MNVDEEIQKQLDDKNKEIDSFINDFISAIGITVAILLLKENISISFIDSEIQKDISDFNIKMNKLTSTIKPDILTLTLSKFNEKKLSKKNEKIVNDFIKLTKNDFSLVLSQLSSELSLQVYNSSLLKEKRILAISKVNNIINSRGKGGNSIKGMKILFVTKVLELSSLVNKIVSAEKGITNWKYVGPNDGKTRPWCRAHVNKVLNTQEIQDWNNQSWKGKKFGDPFIERGGWNCRHHWLPVLTK